MWPWRWWRGGGLSRAGLPGHEHRWRAGAVVGKSDVVEIDRHQLGAARQELWPSIGNVRTTNPIESTFATVRLRTAKTKGCLSRNTALTTPKPTGLASV